MSYYMVQVSMNSIHHQLQNCTDIAGYPFALNVLNWASVGLALKNQSSSDYPVILVTYLKGNWCLVANLACETKQCSFYWFHKEITVSFLVVFDKNGQAPLKIASMV